MPQESLPRGSQLKRNVVVRPIACRRLLRFAALSVGSTAQESNLLSHDLSDVLLLAFFVVVGSVAERAFDVNLTPFL